MSSLSNIFIAKKNSRCHRSRDRPVERRRNLFRCGASIEGSYSSHGPIRPFIYRHAAGNGRCPGRISPVVLKSSILFGWCSSRRYRHRRCLEGCHRHQTGNIITEETLRWAAVLIHPCRCTTKWQVVADKKVGQPMCIRKEGSH